MSAFTSYPPIRHHSSQRISTQQAQQLLAEFLEETTTDASLHPNALLTENGPITPSSGSTGLVLHNLKRVEAGLRGEHLAADLTFKDFGGEGLPDLTVNEAPNGDRAEKSSKKEAEQGFEEDWQDKDEYEREQATEQGEVGPRNNALGDETLDRRPRKEAGKIPAVKRAGGTTNGKEERKRKKREKRKQDRKDREAGKRKNAKAEKLA